MEQQTALPIYIPQPRPFEEITHFRAASGLAAIRSLRLAVARFMSHSRLSVEDQADMELAVGEACANAVRHGSPRGTLDEVRVHCVSSEKAMVVEVCDDGDGFEPGSLPETQPRAAVQGGMGIFLMRRLVDLVEFEFSSGTLVRLTKFCR